MTKPDIIHIVFEDPVSAVLSFFLSRKYPVIVTEHDPKLHDGEMILIRILFKKIPWPLSDVCQIHQTMQQ